MTKDDLRYWKGYLEKYGHLSNDYGLFSKMYAMTTENIREFVDKVDCMDKDVLTVVGSGDQTMNVILNGAKNITCFDINPMAFNHLKLKKAAISTLSFEEYCKFFYIIYCYNMEHSFLDRKLFDKVATKLDDETISLFHYMYDFSKDSILYDYCRSDNVKFERVFYFSVNYDITIMRNANNYINPEGYEKLAYILNNEDINIDFIETDFIDLKNNIGDKKFDLIMLSNISDYIGGMYYKNPLVEFYNDINALIDHLNQFGTIEVGYLYNNILHEEDCIRIREKNYFDDRNEREKVFTTDKFYTRLVTAYDFNMTDDNDKIITYQKLT